MTDDLVSCLCVTRGGADLLAAARLWSMQTYARKELIVVHQSSEADIRSALSGLAHVVTVPAPPEATLGELRNLALDAATGEWVAQWDDDDMHMPTRLERQLAGAKAWRAEACFLSRWFMHDVLNGAVYLSGKRCWEGSMVARKAALAGMSYAPLARAEDSAFVSELVHAYPVVMLDAPELYVYRYHGRNAWDRGHWERLFARATLVDADEEQAQLLAADSDLRGAAVP